MNEEDGALLQKLTALLKRYEQRREDVAALGKAIEALQQAHEALGRTIRRP